ncbi:hypothetical protein BH11PSE12_BH11PSE12_22220 [soil metagenome]
MYSCLPGADEESLGLSPVLVEFSETGINTWNRLLNKTENQPALSLIVSMESLEQLSARLIPWCVIDANGYSVTLAFADTRVLPQLFKVLTPEQIAQLCGPMLFWQYVQRDANWAQLPMPCTDQHAADKVMLSEPQCSALTDASEADNVLYKFKTASPALLQHILPAEAHASVIYWLACAEHANIESPPDRLSLCEFGIRNPYLMHRDTITNWKNKPRQSKTIDNLCQDWLTLAAT